LVGVVAGDDVTLDTTAVAGAFDDANVGTGKAVTISGLGLTGDDAGSYTLSAPSATADITGAPTTTALASSENPSAPGSNVTFTATVTAGVGTPGGEVVFLANAVPFSTNALVGGVAAVDTAVLPLGTNLVVAEYAVQGNYLGSSDSLEQVVQSLVVCSQTNAIVGIADNQDGTFTLTFVGTPQAQYYVVGSGDVVAPMSSWAVLPGSTNTVSDPSGLWQITVTNTAAQQYYRSTAVVPCP
ncbi:MAG TPA: YDG domain-containing protein, partial [Verrucomicrobiota bacterium]|nr:YDG domain-containing protein [Verrucomicrobiota bacterium]